MPIPIAAAIGIQAGSSLLGGMFGRSAARERERAIQDASTTAGAGYREAQGRLDPRMDQETAAMGRVNALLGLEGEDPDYDLFRDTPGYGFQMEEGARAIERSAAARGGLASGNTLVDLTRYSQGLADSTFNNYLAQVMQLQSQGTDYAMANLDTGRANRLADLRVGAGNARASGYEAVGSAVLGGAAGAMDLWSANRSQNALSQLARR